MRSGVVLDLVILSGGRSPESKNLYPQGTSQFKAEIFRLRCASLSEVPYNS
jgi:hypothetical protein